MYDEILDILLDQELGKIACANIVLSIEHNVIRREDGKSFVKEWWDGVLAEHNVETVLSFEYLENQFYALVHEKENSYRGGIRDDGVLCATPIHNNMAGEDDVNMSCVRCYEDLYQYTLATCDPENGSLLPDPEHAEFKSNMDAASSAGTWERPWHLKAGGRISALNSVCWLCPSSELIKMIASRTYKADCARDYLGLIHQGQEDKSGRVQNFLFSFEVDNEHVRDNAGAVCCVRPTFIDSGFHSRFKSIPDDPVRQAAKEPWGIALDLQKHGDGAALADGGSEYVLREDDCRRKKMLRLTPLGFPTSTRQDGNAERTEFVARLMRTGGLTVPSVRRFLVDLVG